MRRIVLSSCGPRSEGTPDAGHARSLMERKRCGNMEHLVDICPRRLRKPPARIGRERLKVAPRALGVEDAERERRFAGPGDARHADDFIERNVDVDVPEIVHARAAHFDPAHHCAVLRFFGKTYSIIRPMLRQKGPPSRRKTGLSRSAGSERINADVSPLHPSLRVRRR